MLFVTRFFLSLKPHFKNLDWTLATLYNLAGKDGKEDFDLLMADSEESESASWFDVVEDEYTHDFRFGDDGDVFDANDKSYRVSLI